MFETGKSNSYKAIHSETFGQWKFLLLMCFGNSEKMALKLENSSVQGNVFLE